MTKPKRPPDPAEKAKAKQERDSGVIWHEPPPVSGPYPTSIGKGAGTSGKSHPMIAEDQQGYSGFNVAPKVRRKPQEAHTGGTFPGAKLSSRNKIGPSTNALIRTTGNKKK